MSATQTLPGIVLYYQRGQCRDCGVVAFGDRRVAFGSSYFHMGRPARHPKAGDEVEAVIAQRANGPRVIYIRPLRGVQ